VKKNYLSLFGRTAQEDPLKVFAYLVEFDGFTRFGFSACTTPGVKTTIVLYREGGHNTTALKSPGLTEIGDIQLKRGQILAAGYGSADILQWSTQVFDVSQKGPRAAKDFRRTVDIVQLDREGNEALRWRVLNCWPSEAKMASDLDALQSDNSVETMTLANEGFRLVS
jgi:phage tail-like protein